MIKNRVLKRIMVCGAALLMLGSVGSASVMGMNASARHVRTHRHARVRRHRSRRRAPRKHRVRKRSRRRPRKRARRRTARRSIRLYWHGSTANQHGNALAPYHADYSYVYNRDLYRPTFRYDRGNSLKTPVDYWKGTPRVSFKPYFQFNVNTDPQSMAILPNGMMYIMYSDEDGYDNIVKEPLNNNINDPLMLTAGKIGPSEHLGHGQTMSYNPHAHTLWMFTIPHGYVSHSSATEISTRTLKPIRRINFTFSHEINMGDDLTFDGKGNAYVVDKTFSGKKNALKIFKGTVNKNGVKFHLVHQLIRHAPGHVVQNMSYNPANGRLYVVSDGAIMSFPASKVGHLKASDVRDVVFKQHREFEQVGFHNGRGYLLVNSPEAVLRSTNRM